MSKFEAQPAEPSFVHKGPKVIGTPHFAQRVFNANRDPGVPRVQDQVLQRAERRIALARIGGFPRTTHVQDEPRVGQVIGDVDHTLQLVHGFDAAHSFDFADRKRRAALAHRADVPAGRRVERDQLQAVRFQRTGHRAHFLLHGVFEVAARAENLYALKSSLRDLPEQVRR
jgi:hypothetical protein